MIAEKNAELAAQAKELHKEKMILQKEHKREMDVSMSSGICHA